MVIVIPFCHLDSDQALRLLFWLKRHDSIPKDVKALMSLNQRAFKSSRGQNVLKLAKAWFDADHFVPHDEDESGWPKSCTHLFQRTLDFLHEDFFWLEADCVPLGSDWFTRLWDEYKSAGKVFMGAMVYPPDTRYRKHMTGNGFYGKAWREVTPDFNRPLPGAITHAWDIDYADMVLPHAHITGIIQHAWNRFDPKHAPKKANLWDKAALYHQCKTGALMNELDPEFAEWRLTLDLSHLGVCNTMSRHFLTRNVSKPVLVAGRAVPFIPVMYFAASSSYWGVREAADAAEAVALSELVDRGLIKALTVEEFDAYLEKKNGTSASPSSKPLNATKPTSAPAVIAAKVARVVDEAKPAPVEVAEAPKVETVAEALTTQVVPPQRETLAPKPRRSR